jgi:hypothetical protein
MFTIKCSLDGNTLLLGSLYHIRLEHVTAKSTLPDLMTLTLRYENGMPVDHQHLNITLVSRSTFEKFDSLCFKITGTTDRNSKKYIIHIESHEIFPCFTNPFEIKENVMIKLSTGYIDNIVGWAERVIPLLDSHDGNEHQNDIYKIQDIMNSLKSIKWQ